MAMSLASIQHGVSFAPPRILIYGVQGIGKTTMLEYAPDPILIQTEDGEGITDIKRFPLAKTFDEVIDAISVLANSDHNYKTVCVDSLDWLEPMVWEKTVLENPTTNKSGGTASGIESYGYGKGYAMALDYWREYISGLNYLRNEKGMMVIQTAHSKITRFESPDSDSYDKYELKLQHSPKTSASALLQEHSDIVLFANYKIGFTQEKKGDQVRKRAVGSGDRMIYTQERPAYSAKNRYDLPQSIPFDKEGNYWGVLAQHIPFLNNLVKEMIVPNQSNETQPQQEGA